MLMENVKVSIITPMHNSAKFISETINSVLNQTHKNFELILIDDCSSDETIKAVNVFLNDKRIKLFKNEKNYGAAYSRNLGIREATGEYIAFLDGDDLWSPTKLESQLKFMNENNVDFSCTYYSLIDENGAKLDKYITAPKKITHKMLMKSCYMGCLTVMYKKSLYPNLQIPDSILKRNDYAMWLKISEISNCYCLNKYLAMYRKRNDSVSSISKRKLFKYHIDLFEKLYGFSSIKSLYYATVNSIYYIVKRFKFMKKGSKTND